MILTLSTLTSHELYLKAKQQLLREFVTGRHPGLLANRIYEECKRRDVTIWNKAVEDSMTISSSIRNALDSYPNSTEKIITVNRIDFTTIHELNAIMGTSHKSLESIIKLKEGFSFVNVTGDSMKDEDILAGDVVITEEVIDIDDGAPVLVAIKGKKIIKRIKYTHEGIELESANKNHKPMLVPHGEVEILGVVRLCIKAVV